MVYTTRGKYSIYKTSRVGVFFWKKFSSREDCAESVLKVWLNYNKFVLSKRTWFDYWWVFVGVFSARFSYFVGYFCGYPHFYPVKLILFCDIDKYFYDRICFFRKLPTSFGTTIGDLWDICGLSVAFVMHLYNNAAKIFGVEGVLCRRLENFVITRCLKQAESVDYQRLLLE